MSYVSPLLVLALLALLLVRESRGVHSSTVTHRPWPVALHAELVLWGMCAALVLPRLVELLT
jgi:hypothetical protein